MPFEDSPFAGCRSLIIGRPGRQPEFNGNPARSIHPAAPNSARSAATPRRQPCSEAGLFQDRLRRWRRGHRLTGSARKIRRASVSCDERRCLLPVFFGFVVVMLDMELAGFLGMMRRVEVVAVRQMGVVRRLLDVLAAMVLGGIAVMLGSLLMMVSGLLMVVGELGDGHGCSSLETDDASAAAELGPASYSRGGGSMTRA
jgi:hypothetical protein